MTEYVYPRLPTAAALHHLREFADRPPADLRHLSAVEHPDAAPVATGGSPVPTEVLRDVAREVRLLADHLAFPDELGRARVADFDIPCGLLLHDRMRIVPADAAAEGVWSFLSLVVLPDVAVWRFPSRAQDRLTGRPRNVFRRPWWRVEILGQAGSGTLDEGGAPLGEDEMVQIMERPRLAANPAVARSVARVLRRSTVTPGGRSELMRDLAKRYLRLMPVVSLDSLDADALDHLGEQLCRQSVEMLSGRDSTNAHDGEPGPQVPSRRLAGEGSG
jgi:hypothetical protein